MPKSLLVPVLFLFTVAACSDTADTTPDEVPSAMDETPPSAAHPPSLNCGVADDAVLTGDGIGRLRIGATVAELRAECRVLRDNVVPFREGTLERVLLVDLVRDTVEALVESDRVTLLIVDSPAFRAAGGLGVGSTIADLRATGAGTVSREEGTHIQLGERCGLVFYPGPMQAPLRATLAELPADGKIERLLVAGCGSNARYYSR